MKEFYKDMSEENSPSEMDELMEYKRGCIGVMVVLAVFMCILMCCSCKKKEDAPRIYSVTYTTYAINPFYLLEYVDKDEVMHKDTIRTNSAQIIVQVTEAQFHYLTQVRNMALTANDSIYLRADMNGKNVSQGFSFSNAWATAGVQLTSLK